MVVTGLTLAGAALPQLVVASDSGNSNPSELTDEFAALSLDPLPQYLRWYFSAGLAVGTMAMGTPLTLSPSTTLIAQGYFSYYINRRK